MQGTMYSSKETMQKKSWTFQDELKTLNAKFEVKLKITYEKIKEDLRSFELNKIKKFIFLLNFKNIFRNIIITN